MTEDGTDDGADGGRRNGTDGGQRTTTQTTGRMRRSKHDGTDTTGRTTARGQTEVDHGSVFAVRTVEGQCGVRD